MMKCWTKYSHDEDTALHIRTYNSNICCILQCISRSVVLTEENFQRQKFKVFPCSLYTSAPKISCYYVFFSPNNKLP